MGMRNGMVVMSDEISNRKLDSKIDKADFRISTIKY